MMKKSVKKYQPGGLVDSEGNPVRDSSGQPIMTGSGRKEADMEAKMEDARKKLAQDVQEKLKSDKAAKDDADFAAEDARSKTGRAVAGAPAKTAPAKKAPIVTKEELAKSGLSLRDYMNDKRGLMRKDGKVALRKGDMDMKSPAEKRSATRMADVAAKKPQAERRSDTRLRASKASATSSDEANMTFKKGGSINGIAKRGLTKCKMR